MRTGNWKRVACRATASGTSASVLSLLALVCLGQRDCASAFAPINAVSHWIWRGRALHQQSASLRYTLPGYLIHHAMSILWAVLFESRTGTASGRSARALVATGLAVAGVACFVDLRCTPERLTPGFERRLRPGSLALVYLAFGLGLALPAICGGRRGR